MEVWEPYFFKVFFLGFFDVFQSFYSPSQENTLKFGNIKLRFFVKTLQAKGIVYGKPTNQGINKWKAFSGEADSRIDEQLPLTSRIG